MELPGRHVALFTDTVGFIQKLPTELVAAFRATLEEIAEADLLLHMVDITHPNALEQWKSVQDTLAEIEADHIPVFTAMNKIDRLPNPEVIHQMLAEVPNSFAISAKTGQGIAELIGGIESQLFETYIPVNIRLPYQQGQLISLFHEQGQINRIEHGRGGVQIRIVTGGLLAFSNPLSTRKQPDRKRLTNANGPKQSAHCFISSFQFLC